MPPKKTASTGPASRGAAAAKTAAKGKAPAKPAANPRGRPSASSNYSAEVQGSTISARETITIDSDDEEVPLAQRRRVSRQGEDEDMRDAPEVERSDEEEEKEEEDDGRAKIPPELITRVLHEFFTKEKGDTRITKDANEAVVKYVDVFVREAIARTAAEKEGGFLELEDLERITPQLLMDL